MLESPAFRVLSQSGHRVLARIEIELAHHGGNDNGQLPVTFQNFEEYGIDRHSIAPAIRECEALGFIRIPVRGRAGNGEFRTPHKFRLTYLHALGENPTHEWARIEAIQHATELAQAARRASTGVRKSRKPVGENTNTSGGDPHQKPNPPVGEIHTTVQVGNPTLHSISGDHGPERSREETKPTITTNTENPPPISVPRAKPQMPLSSEWQPNAEHYAWAQTKGRSRQWVNEVATDMRLWAESKDERRVDWDQVLMIFMRKQVTPGSGGTSGGGPRQGMLGGGFA
jgi:hypothetical protein